MKIDRNDDFGGCLLTCAVRYALGRRSYMPSLVVDEITPMLPDCSDKTLWCFEKDCAEYLQEDGGLCRFFSEDDKQLWSRFLAAVRQEMQKRKEPTEDEK